MITVLQSPEDQIAEARWWVAELRLDLPPGCTTRLTAEAERRLAELEARYARGELEPVEVVVDETVLF